MSQKLIDKIIEALNNNGGSLSELGLANAIYDNCMNWSHPSNGARVSNIVRACIKDERIGQFHSGGSGWFLLPPKS